MHAFISYVVEDKEQVFCIANYLQRYGIEIWLDKNNILPGQRFSNIIKSAIESGDFFIACFSNNYWNRSKTYMNEELNTAIDELRLRQIDRSWFIPVLLSDCKVPAIPINRYETLRDIQWVPLYKDFELGMKQIVDVVLPLTNSKIIEDLLEDIRSSDNNTCKLALNKLSKLPDFGDVRIIRALVEIMISETTNEQVSLDIMNSINNYKDEVIEIISDLIINSQIVNKHAIEILAKISSPLSITEAIPEFVDKCKKKGLKYDSDKLYRPYFAWHLSLESFERIKDLFLERKPRSWTIHGKGHEVSLNALIRNLKPCIKCNREAICICVKEKHDSGDTWWEDTYECAYCKYYWTEEWDGNYKE